MSLSPPIIQRRQTRLYVQGFTIVELLIVIVVIAVLAAITIVAYNGIQQRSRDTRRTSDLVAIQKVLELYKTDNGAYPLATDNPGSSGWELSTDVAGTFLEPLKPYASSAIPLDPTNTSSSAYWYYFYKTDSSVFVTAGCNPARGGIYVLRAIYEKSANKPDTTTIDTSSNGCNGTIPGNWMNSGTAYVVTRFVN